MSGLLHLVYPHRFPAHAAHTFSPWLGTMCFGGHCKHRHRHYPAGTFGEQDTFSTSLVLVLTNPPPGTDDPSEPTWLGLRGLSRELIATAVPTPTAAPLRLLRPRARGSMRRELHAPFMPDGSRTGNKEDRGSITFIVHRLIHMGRGRLTPGHHEGPFFMGPIAADSGGSGVACGKQQTMSGFANRKYGN